MNKGLVFAIDLKENKYICNEEIMQVKNHWLHFDYKEADTKLWFLERSNLPKDICHAFLDSKTNERFIVKDNGFFFIFRALNLNEGQEKEDMVSLRIWVDEKSIITMRSRKVVGIDYVRDNLLNNKSESTKKIFLDILDKLSDTTSNYIDELYDVVEEIDEILMDNHSNELRLKISNLRKKTIELKRFILPQKNILEQVLKENIFSGYDKSRFKNILEHNGRITENLSALRERANVCHEEFQNKGNEKMNKTMYILTILSTIFLPLNFIGSLLGVNLAGIPGANNPNSFYFLCILVIIIGIIEYIWFKKNKYL